MSLAVRNWSAVQKREVVAQAGTVLAGLLILLLVQNVVMSQEVPVKENTISISLLDPPPEPKKIVEPPKPKVEPPVPKKITQPPKVVTPVVAAPTPVKSEVVVPVTPVTVPQPVAKPVPVQPAPVQRISNSAAEGEFAQDVRTRIERKKIYPDTARDLGMSGEVEILYELDRAGKLLRAEIATSSGFKQLDRAALNAVKSADYKAFPEDAWLGANSKVFRTKLVFSINQ